MLLRDISEEQYQHIISLKIKCGKETPESTKGTRKLTMGWTTLFASYYSLANVGYCVHPAANADLVAYIWRVTELMHYSNVIRIGTLEQLALQSYGIDLGKRNQRGRNEIKEM